MYYALSIATVAGINIICVSGLTILTGFTGMFSMGHAGFMAIGGYTAAVLYLQMHVPFLLAVLLGGVAAALSSLIVGIPTIHNRLNGVDLLRNCDAGLWRSDPLADQQYLSGYQRCDGSGRHT